MTGEGFAKIGRESVPVLTEAAIATEKALYGNGGGNGGNGRRIRRTVAIAIMLTIAVGGHAVYDVLIWKKISSLEALVVKLAESKISREELRKLVEQSDETHERMFELMGRKREYRSLRRMMED